MATQEQIEALKIDENVFELAEDTELEYLVHFAAPFTGGDRCLVPKGTAFAPHSPMRGDALYMHLADEDNEELFAKMATTKTSSLVCKASHFSLQKSNSKRSLLNSVAAVQSDCLTSCVSCAPLFTQCFHKPIELPLDIYM